MQNFPLSPRDTEGDIFKLLSHKTFPPKTQTKSFKIIIHKPVLRKSHCMNNKGLFFSRNAKSLNYTSCSDLDLSNINTFDGAQIYENGVQKRVFCLNT